MQRRVTEQGVQKELAACATIHGLWQKVRNLSSLKKKGTLPFHLMSEDVHKMRIHDDLQGAAEHGELGLAARELPAGAGQQHRQVDLGVGKKRAHPLVRELPMSLVSFSSLCIGFTNQHLCMSSVCARVLLVRVYVA